MHPARPAFRQTQKQLTALPPGGITDIFRRTGYRQKGFVANPAGQLRNCPQQDPCAGYEACWRDMKYEIIVQPKCSERGTGVHI